MITFPTSQIQKHRSFSPVVDPPRRRSPKCTLATQLVHQSSFLKADAYARSAPSMRGNVVDQRVQWRRLPSRASSAALKDAMRRTKAASVFLHSPSSHRDVRRLANV